jgi:hypothetical protein
VVLDPMILMVVPSQLKAELLLEVEWVAKYHWLEDEVLWM